ncbi:MAG: hypothetical protein DI530_08490 [Sphingomonas sp.]|uniref:acyltransferase family protein n=1 Tax=Sphingomonas sp. TaxID=28214 RepID=UPI000DBC3901|nr:acyltransferase [Sphingomonas sp.]PZU79623.1 MAG: hypothetical protein DI530_08490 [Sphingomonas sp.]
MNDTPSAPHGVVATDVCGSAAQPVERSRPSAAYIYMDAMRALCAIGVALSHVWSLLIGDYVPTTNLVVRMLYFLAGFGHAGVVLFFVLSGYWITRSVVTRTAAGAWSWGGYLIDRLARLLVVLVPVLLVGGSLDYIAAVGLESTTLHDQTGSYMIRVPHERSLSVQTLLGNLLFLQGLVVPPFGSNGPLWSLAYEFWFYVWFPALWLLARHRRPSLALLALALGAAFPDLALGFLTWSCGSLLFFAERAARRRARVWTWLGRHALLPAILVSGGTLFWLRASGYFWLDGLVALSFAAFLLTLIAADPPIPGAVMPFATFGSRASFSLYATHFPVVAFVATLVVDRVRPQPDAASVSLAYAVLAGCALLAWFFARVTEARTDVVRHAARRIILRGTSDAERGA